MSIGRWWQLDPVVDLYDLTPYNFGFNNPVTYSDPKGDCPPTICGAINRSVIGGVAGGIIVAIDGQDLEGILTSAAGGAISGGYCRIRSRITSWNRCNNKFCWNYGNKCSDRFCSGSRRIM